MKLPPYRNGLRVVQCYSHPEPMWRIDTRDGGVNVPDIVFHDDTALGAVVVSIGVTAGQVRAYG